MLSAILGDRRVAGRGLKNDTASNAMTFDSSCSESAVSSEEAEALLDRLLLREAEIDTRLEQLLIPDSQQDLASLLKLQDSLQIEQHLLLLSERIGPAAETAIGLSERVRKLDTEQGRVKECLKYVEDVQELKVYNRVVLPADR